MQVELTPEMEASVAAAAEGMGAAAFVHEAVSEKLRRNVSSLPLSDAALLAQINRGFPDAFWRRYRELIARRDAETMTAEEQEELIRLTDQKEEQDAERLVYLIEMARRRDVSVDTLMRDLGLRPTPVTDPA